MTDRRDFMKWAVAGSTLVATNSILMGCTSAATRESNPGGVDAAGSKNSSSLQTDGKNLGKNLGLGGVPLAGAWIPTTADQTWATMQAAWDVGVRYFDTSPRYGFGVSERRMGQFLDSKNQAEFVISTKVGRLLTPGKGDPAKLGIWKGQYNAGSVYDYSASGTRRSIEDSLQRMGLSHFDIIFIHDLSPDNGDMKESFDRYYNQAAKGAIPELVKMKKEGIIKGWGFGINRPDAALRSLSIAKPDICLLATQYSLLDHEEALTKTFPALEKAGTKVVVGSPLNCGYLAGNERWNYSGKPAPQPMQEKREQLRKVCAEMQVDMRTAALQFSQAHPIVSSVCVGARSAKQITENYQSLYGAKVPKAFWDELRRQGLIHAEAPVAV